MRFGVVASVALALGAGCVASPTTLVVHAILPPGEPIEAAFFDVTLTGFGPGVNRLLYERPVAQDGVRDQSFVVILPDEVGGRTVQLLVQAREARSFVDGGEVPDAGELSGTPGDPTGRVVAAGAASLTIAGERDNLITVPLQRL